MKNIGSEKIQNVDEKLKRILEISGIVKGASYERKETYGKQSNILHESKASDGKEYAIVQESKYVYIKVKKNNNYDYLTGAKNIHEHSYKSYADALKHLNMMFKEINERVDYKDNIDVLKKKL